MVHECNKALEHLDEAGIDATRGATAAERDVMRFWAQDQARWAAALTSIIQQNLTAGTGGGGGPWGGPAVDVYARTSPAACDAFCTPPHGAGTSPKRGAELVHGALTGVAEYSHNYVFWMNDVVSAAFRAQGHGVIDVEAMLSARVDAYPASSDGRGDKLHYCQPGPADWALDVLLRRVATVYKR